MRTKLASVFAALVIVFATNPGDLYAADRNALNPDNSDTNVIWNQANQGGAADLNFDDVNLPDNNITGADDALDMDETQLNPIDSDSDNSNQVQDNQFDRSRRDLIDFDNLSFDSGVADWSNSLNQ